MKTFLSLFLSIVFIPFGFSQASRKQLRAQAVNDSLKVENLIIFNVNARVGTIAKYEGAFTIPARVNDTLVLSGLVFKSKKIVITQDDLDQDVLKIQMQAYPNQLAEVLVDQKIIKAPKINPRAESDKKYFDDRQSSPKNTVMPNYNAIENGADFVRMYRDVLKILRKKNPKKSALTSGGDFTELVMQKINYTFFASSLKLPDDQIRLFLVFCENDPKAKTITKASTNFELMDFLVTENEEFQQIVAAQKN